MVDGVQSSAASGVDESSDCSVCETGRVRRVGVFEHARCGFVDIAARFDALGSDLGCPKCEARLAVEDEELRCVAFVFHCSVCDRRFDGVTSLAPSAARTAESD